MNEHGLHDLVVRARDGDGPARGELFLRTEEELRRFARVLLGDNWDHKSSSDLVQETWRRALDALAEFRGGDGDKQTAALLRSWLKRIMRNYYRNEQRADHRLPQAVVSLDTPRSDDSTAVPPGQEPTADLATASAELRRREVRDRVRQVLEQLPEDERQVVELVLIEGKSNVETAAELGVDESTVRYRLHEKALPRLRVLLKELR